MIIIRIPQNPILISTAPTSPTGVPRCEGPEWPVGEEKVTKIASPACHSSYLGSYI